jgi:Na+-translocating ferredoxin:NAD+ oxidoreductase RnfG subunit
MLDLILLSVAQLPIAHVARAEVFFSEEQVVHTMFPKLILTKKTADLTDEQISKIEKASGQDVRDKKITFFQAKSGEAVIIDRVLGKHEMITYAVALDAKGKIQQIEVMEYRETYGHEIKRPEWRKQFYGLDKDAEIKLDKEIHNVSGATLSCKHVTDGVRRVLQTYELIKST